MPKKPKSPLPARLPIPIEMIERRIYLIRGQKVMLSHHLAELYGVEPRALVQAVKRNLDRFPLDFMFPLTPCEFSNLKSQFVISSWGGRRRAAPYAFTQEGVAMLSSVLHSKRAVALNIAIMRAFVRLREVLAAHKDLATALEKLKNEQKSQGKKIKEIIVFINKLLAPLPEPPRRPIGFRPSGGK
ncbi:MAG: ORF6N domain-containing protein [Acidobacteriia bacterium]|nr:ORF6N domain-containing protein [Terriglobia bacterium]